MAKVKCKVCANEVSGFCSVKKIGVKVNKHRICEAYVYDEARLKMKTEIPTVRVGYAEQQENKRRMKAELKRIKEELKKKPLNGTARDLGLIDDASFSGEESRIITPGDPRFSMPRNDIKHPLTGDLSRFMTTASNKE